MRYSGGFRVELLTDDGWERRPELWGEISGMGGYTGTRELAESEVKELLAEHPAGVEEILKFKTPAPLQSGKRNCVQPTDGT